MKLPLLTSLLAVAALTACSAPPDGEPSGSEGSDLTIGHFPPILTPQYPQLDLEASPNEFMVFNEGKAASPSFYVAVISGLDSYSVSVGPMAPGSYQTFVIRDTVENCGNNILIIVDPEKVVNEGGSPGKHIGQVTGTCRID